MGTVSYNLGGVKMPYLHAEIPKYRGVQARVVTMDAPAEHFDALKNLARGLAGGPTYFEVTAPDKPGNKPGEATVRIDGIYILRVVKHNRQTCYVMFADARILLSRRVGDIDIRVRFGDGYLEGTDVPTYRAAVEKFVTSIDILTSGTSSAAYVDFGDASTRDHSYLSGLTLPNALGSLLEESGNSFTVGNDGKYRFPAQEDLLAVHKLPVKSAYAWHVEPGWEILDSLILGTPRRVVNYYHERHCLRLEGSDPNTTISSRGADELWAELEQVYSSEGNIYTLSELLEANGFGENDITDAQIAARFWTETFEGTTLYDSYGTGAFERVHGAIRSDWRRLWRIKFPKSKGHLGAWTDWAFGKINADGSVSAVAVECPWVKFLVEIAVQDGNSIVGSPATFNMADNSPFSVQWEGDVSAGVIRMIPKALDRGAVAVPGALLSPLVLEANRDGAIADGKQNVEKLDEFVIIERQDIGKARFDPSFQIAIYVCATKRMPNDETRWHARSVTTGLSDADIEYIEQPPSGELMLVRDYVHPTEQGHGSMGDGYGPYLNDAAVQTDAELRTEAWKIQHAAALDGYGIAESVMLFRDHEVRGPINEISLTIEGQVVRTKITAGNLADTNQRNRVAQKRLADRKFKTQGVQ